MISDPPGAAIDDVAAAVDRSEVAAQGDVARQQIKTCAERLDRPALERQR